MLIEGSTLAGEKQRRSKVSPLRGLKDLLHDQM
jgi:hypothetical protein